MSDPARLSRFLSQRLARMGVEVRYFEGESSAQGELRLREQAFPTLAEPLQASSARFYTLGHNRLKFWSPGAFFDLPALDVGGCESADQIENALRQSWAARMRDLVEARAWLERLGASGRAAAHGTRLLLPVGLERTPPAYVRSASEILLPSGGPLADVSLAEPAQRRHRPLRSLEHASELDLGLASQLARLAQKQSGVAAAAAAKPDRSLAPLPRVLVVDDAPDALDALQMALLAAGFEVDGFRDPALALNAFQLRSYGAVVAEARLRQVCKRERSEQTSRPRLARDRERLLERLDRRGPFLARGQRRAEHRKSPDTGEVAANLVSEVHHARCGLEQTARVSRVQGLHGERDRPQQHHLRLTVGLSERPRALGAASRLSQAPRFGEAPGLLEEARAVDVVAEHVAAELPVLGIGPERIELAQALLPAPEPAETDDPVDL